MRVCVFLHALKYTSILDQAKGHNLNKLDRLKKELTSNKVRWQMSFIYYLDFWLCVILL